MILVLWICVPLFWSCVIRTRDTAKDVGIASVDRLSAVENPDGTSGSGLIKPVISEESEGDKAGAGESLSNEADHRGAAPAGGLSATAPPISATGSPGPRGDRLWEDQQVKKLALDMAAKTPGVRKIQVCFALKTDEWMIILYVEDGSEYELKQFFWNKDKTELEPYRVFERIPKQRLEERLSKSEPDKACETFDPPR